MINNVFKVRGEWLVNDYGGIAYNPLNFWLEYYEAIPITVDGDNDEKIFVGWWSKRFQHRLNIFGKGGYGISKRAVDDGVYTGDLFYVGNADLDVPSIRLFY